MSTSFSSLPIVSLSVLSDFGPKPEELEALSARLDQAFSTTGFAYLTDLPLTSTHDDVFRLCDDFFGLPIEEKMKLAKKTFVKDNQNTYRGYGANSCLKSFADFIIDTFQHRPGMTASKKDSNSEIPPAVRYPPSPIQNLTSPSPTSSPPPLYCSALTAGLFIFNFNILRLAFSPFSLPL